MSVFNKTVKKIDFYYDITSISSWILFERFNVLRRRFPSIEHCFKPVHSSSLLTITGNKIPFLTPTLRKNYFEEQRVMARMHGITIGTNHEIIDELLVKLSNTMLPQCFMNMVAVQCTAEDLLQFSRILWRELWIKNRTVHSEKDLLRLLSKATARIPEEQIIFDPKWGKLLDNWNKESLNDQQCFDIPWTVLHFNDGTNKAYNGSDKWPLICSFLDIEPNQLNPILVNS